MRLRVRIAPLLLLWSILHLNAFSQSPRAGNTYFQGSIDQMRQQAKTLQKPYILFFHAEWSDPSKDVELNCIENAQIQDFIKREFLLYKVEMDSRATNAPVNQLARFYKVSLYPTFIFFAPDGFILKKLAGQLNVQSFGEELNATRKLALDREELDLSGELGEREEDWIPDDFFEGDKERPAKDNSEKMVDNTEPNWPELIEDETPSKTSQVSLQHTKERYGIQLGAYTKKIYAQKMLDKVLGETNFPAKIRETYVNGLKYYKVVVGPYASKPKAEQERLEVVRELGNSGCFVVEID